MKPARAAAINAKTVSITKETLRAASRLAFSQRSKFCRERAALRRDSRRNSTRIVKIARLRGRHSGARRWQVAPRVRTANRERSLRTTRIRQNTPAARAIKTADGGPHVVKKSGRAATAPSQRVHELPVVFVVLPSRPSIRPRASDPIPHSLSTKAHRNLQYAHKSYMPNGARSVKSPWTARVSSSSGRPAFAGFAIATTGTPAARALCSPDGESSTATQSAGATAK